MAQNCKKIVLKINAQHKVRSEEVTEDNKRLERNIQREHSKGMAGSSMIIDGGKKEEGHSPMFLLILPSRGLLT